MTKVPKVVNDFLIYLTAIKGKSKRTRTEYAYDLILLLKFITCIREELDYVKIDKINISEINIEFIKEISLEELYAFLEYCEETRNNGTCARARKVACIKSFFNYIVNKKQLLQINPAIELESPSIAKKQPIYMTFEESKCFINSIKHTKHYYRDYCIITLFLNCALRISELCNLDLSSVNLKDGIATVTGKGNKERTIYLNKSCIKALEDYLNNERKNIENIRETSKDALFLSQLGNRLSKRTIQNLVTNINKNSINKEHLTTHKLRHTSATLMYKSGADIRSLQQILGHTNISTTQIYTHIDDNTLKKIVEENPLNLD